MQAAAAQRGQRSCPTCRFGSGPGLVAEILRFYDLPAPPVTAGRAFRGAVRGRARTRRSGRRSRFRACLAADAVSCREPFAATNPAWPAPARATSISCALGSWPSLRRSRSNTPSSRWPTGLPILTGCSSPTSICSRGCPGSRSSISSAPTRVLGSGFHERLHGWWPGLEEVEAIRSVAASRSACGRSFSRLPRHPPRLARAPLWFTYRDREEELIGVADAVAIAAWPAPHERSPSSSSARCRICISRRARSARAGLPWQTSGVAPARRRAGGRGRRSRARSRRDRFLARRARRPAGLTALRLRRA